MSEHLTMKNAFQGYTLAVYTQTVEMFWGKMFSLICEMKSRIIEYLISVYFVQAN